MMKSSNNPQPLKGRFNHNELMSKLSHDLDLHNRLKLAEISKYRQYIKKNNCFDKFSGKKNLIDRDILYSECLKQKYKNINENKSNDQYLLEGSFTMPKLVPTSNLTSKDKNTSSYNPFRVTNETFNNFRVTSETINPFRVTNKTINTFRVSNEPFEMILDKDTLKRFFLKTNQSTQRHNTTSNLNK